MKFVCHSWWTIPALSRGTTKISENAVVMVHISAISFAYHQCLGPHNATPAQNNLLPVCWTPWGGAEETPTGHQTWCFPIQMFAAEILQWCSQQKCKHKNRDFGFLCMKLQCALKCHHVHKTCQMYLVFSKPVAYLSEINTTFTQI